MSTTGTEIAYPMNIVLLGSPNVGKSSFITSYFKGQTYEGDNTFGYQVFTKRIPWTIQEHDFTIELNVWDTAGETLKRTITKNHYERCHAAIFFYDVTSRKSFDE